MSSEHRQMTLDEIVQIARDRGQLPEQMSKMEELFILSKLEEAAKRFCICRGPWPCPEAPPHA